ncbi:MAG: NDP-sugar synthase [Actinomycetota bacterium]|nr:NDP-sugar synthase [Actinomycetota bacterium]
MLAIVLVGGLGTRLRPLTEHTPKQMLPICGVPMIEWVVDHLATHGVKEVGLSLGYHPDEFLNSYPDGQISGIPYRVAVEPEPRGTAGAVRFAADEFGVDDTFLALNGDVLTDLDITELIAFHRGRDAEATIAVQPVSDPSGFGVVSTFDDGLVKEFVEKPEPGLAASNHINAGTYVFEPSVIGRIPMGKEVSIERETFPELVRAGTLYAMPSSTYWLDTGTPEQFIRANLDVLAGRRLREGLIPLADIHSGAQLVDSVIGTHTRVGAFSVIERSVLFHNCEIREETAIIESVLSDSVYVGAGARLERCVIGRGQRVEAGEHLIDVKRPKA